MNYLAVGPTPCDEECAQVGDRDYRKRSQAEGIAYIHQLERLFGVQENGAFLAIKAFPHDFGTYHEVVVWYDPEKKAEVEYAYSIEEKSPAKWDDEARRELQKAGYLTVVSVAAGADRGT